MPLFLSGCKGKTTFITYQTFYNFFSKKILTHKKANQTNKKNSTPLICGLQRYDQNSNRAILNPLFLKKISNFSFILI